MWVNEPNSNTTYLSRLLLWVAFLFLLPAHSWAQDGEPFVGRWQGEILPNKSGGEGLPIWLRLENNALGVLTGTLDSPSQGAYGIALDSLAIIGKGKLTFQIPSINIAISLEQTEEKRLEGSVLQGGQHFRILLYKQPRLYRSQLLKPPFPYLSKEVRIASEDSIILAGTLTIPFGKGPFPTALLLSGSGPLNRDGTIAEHRTLAILADYLARNGIASLRYDTRGTYLSTGDYASASIKEFASDASHALLFLQEQDEVDPQKIGIIGHSEGGVVATMVAADNSSPAFVVLMASVGTTGEDLIKQQITDQYILAGGDTQQINHYLSLPFQIVTAIGQVPSTVSREQLQEKLLPLLPPDLPTAQKEEIVSEYTAPWMVEMIHLHPLHYLARVKCPILAIGGLLDTQVRPSPNLALIEKVLEKEGAKGSKVIRYPGLNHLFQPAKSGEISEYEQISTTLSKEVMEEITKWITTTLSQQP